MTHADVRNLSRRQLDREIEWREAAKSRLNPTWDCRLHAELDELLNERRVRRQHAQSTRMAA